MRVWSFSEAEAGVDGIMDAALRNGPQRIVSEDGRAVVVVSEQESQAALASGQGAGTDGPPVPSTPPRSE